MVQAAASLGWAALSPQGAGEWGGTGSVGRGKNEYTFVALKLDPCVQWCFWRPRTGGTKMCFLYNLVFLEELWCLKLHPGFK